MDTSAPSQANGPVTIRAAKSCASKVGESDGDIIPFGSNVLSFRSFQLLPSARLLLRRGRPVEIGSRAFDLLHVLLRSRGAVVERGDIIRHVWPSMSVDDSSLRFQMSLLRKALGEDRDLLKTVSGRGYIFATDVTETGTAAPRSGNGRLAAGAAVLDSVTEVELAQRCEALRHLLSSALEELWALSHNPA